MSQEEEKQLNSYQRGLIEGIKHSSMSNETRSKIDTLTEKMSELKTELKENCLRKDIFTEKHDQILETLSTILSQVQKTNGRVTNLEKWRSYIAGAVAMLGIVFGIFQFVLPLIIK